MVAGAGVRARASTGGAGAYIGSKRQGPDDVRVPGTPGIDSAAGRRIRGLHDVVWLDRLPRFSRRNGLLDDFRWRR